MYAIVIAGGKQFKVSNGDVIDVEKIDGGVGQKSYLEVLMTVDGDKVVVGKDIMVKAEVEIVSHNKAKKIVVYKYKAKKNERKKQGHRQPFTKIKVLNIG